MTQYKKIIDDVNKANLVSKGEKDFNYKRLYFSSNENLRLLFDNVDIKDKKILSVLSSSDQVFTSFYKGAKCVDSFDVNKLTIYYFYLRKWIVDYLREEYLDDMFYEDSYDLIDIISSIKTDNKDEKDAQIFWLKYIKKNGKIDRYLFNSSNSYYKKDYSDDLEGLSKSIKKMDFYNYDLRDKFSLKKKYDVVILSNILECFNHPSHYIRAKMNIEDLLKDDGICLCSHLMEKKGSLLHEKEVELMTTGNLEYIADYNDYDLGYVYRKGRN